MSDSTRDRIVELLPRLRRFAFALAGSADRADDLVQETCVRALGKIDQWEPGTRLDSWLFKIAQNVWFDRARQGRVRGESVDIDSVLELPGDDGRTVTESRMTLSAVSQAMSRLTPDQQVLIGLVCVDGLAYKEAADVLEVPIGTVMSRLARARRILAEAIGAEASDPSTE